MQPLLAHAVRPCTLTPFYGPLFLRRPAVHAKTARGEMTRFCAMRKLTAPADLKEFSGTSGQWAFVPEASDEERYTFKRLAAGTAAKPATPAAAKPAAAKPAAARGAKRANSDDEAPPVKSRSKR